jgi:hypothetical protein
LTPTAVFPTQAVHIVEHVVAPKLQHWAKLPVVMRLSDVGQLMSSPINEALISYMESIQVGVTHTMSIRCLNTIPGTAHY